MRPLFSFVEKSQTYAQYHTHFILDGTLPVCECVLYMHAQTCARAQMCDVVVACIRGMKGRRLFNTLVQVVSQREVIVFLQQALQSISQSVGYVELQQVMQLEGMAIRDYVPAFFFCLNCMTVMNALSASELSTSLVGSK